MRSPTKTQILGPKSLSPKLLALLFGAWVWDVLLLVSFRFWAQDVFEYWVIEFYWGAKLG